MSRLMRFARSYLLSASTVTLGAFLLFIIQPMAAKHLLPSFGGSSSVWATSLLFFTGFLFLGYLYVFALTRLPHALQQRVHSTLLVIVSLVTVYALAAHGPSALSPSWSESSPTSPAFSVLIALVFAVGGQYFLLSTTGPLVQFWWGAASRSQPYGLYALSNAASLLALVVYPFVIEPGFTLSFSEHLWALIFIVYALCYGILTIGSLEQPPRPLTPPVHLSLRHAAAWISLAALPSYLLVATTTTLTNVVAPMPLLWVLPLALYLVTFILAFRGLGRSLLIAPFVILAAYGAYAYSMTTISHIPLHVLSYMALLFFTGLFCHARLYAHRPDTESLPLFYVLISLGGMIGTLCAGIIAPIIFSDFTEFSIGVALAATTAILLAPEGIFPRAMRAQTILLTRILSCAIIATTLITTVSASDDVLSIQSRNFYGSVQVRLYDGLTSLMHGSTLHGVQPVEKEWRSIPTSYYSPASGIGRALLYSRTVRDGQSLSVGTIGLGTGSLASYCEDGDTFTFYEIDARIETLARTYFTYLSDCPGSSVRIGDGRLLLERELRAGTPQRYDVLALDAFSDDTVPAHLLTTEALRLYAKHLRSDKSILALHISNRFLDLAPMVFRAASEVGMNAMIIRDQGDLKNYAVPSTWVLLSKNSDVFQDVVFSHTDSTVPDTARAPLWTDDYTSILTVVDLESLLTIPDSE